MKPESSATGANPVAETGALGDGVARIAAERRRQIEREGWSAAHDDGHSHGELAISAAELAVDGTDVSISDPHVVRSCWGVVEKHRGNRVRQLEIAGALIAAEIDRQLRRRAPSGEPEGGV